MTGPADRTAAARRAGRRRRAWSGSATPTSCSPRCRRRGPDGRVRPRHHRPARAAGRAEPPAAPAGRAGPGCARSAHGLVEHDGEVVLGPRRRARPTTRCCRCAPRPPRPGTACRSRLSPSHHLAARLPAAAGAVAGSGPRGASRPARAAAPPWSPVWEALDLAGLATGWLPEWARRPHRAAAQRRAPAHRRPAPGRDRRAGATGSLRDVDRPDLLLLAALLHDIGKLPGARDHSVAGAPLATGRPSGWGCRRADADVVERLVREHLTLVELATRRDPDDPRTVEALVAAVDGRRRRARPAAGPDRGRRRRPPGRPAWIAWRARLVDDLVERARFALQGDAPRARRPSPVLSEALVASVRSPTAGPQVARQPARRAARRHRGGRRTGPACSPTSPGMLAAHRLAVRSAWSAPSRPPTARRGRRHVVGRRAARRRRRRRRPCCDRPAPARGAATSGARPAGRAATPAYRARARSTVAGLGSCWCQAPRPTRRCSRCAPPDRPGLLHAHRAARWPRSASTSARPTSRRTRARRSTSLYVAEPGGGGLSPPPGRGRDRRPRRRRDPPGRLTHSHPTSRRSARAGRVSGRLRGRSGRWHGPRAAATRSCEARRVFATALRPPDRDLQEPARQGPAVRAGRRRHRPRDPASPCSTPTSRCPSSASSPTTVRERALGAEVSQALNPAQQVVKIVHDELVAVLGGQTRRIRFAKTPPTVIMLAGLQGAGKTTLAGKLARWLRERGPHAAAGRRRPAAAQRRRPAAGRRRAGRRDGLRPGARHRRRRAPALARRPGAGGPGRRPRPARRSTTS